jgi:hypothetical protein
MTTERTIATLVAQRRASRRVFYAANFAAMSHLVPYLTEGCCGLGRVTALQESFR